MNKSEFIDAVAKESGHTKTDATRIIDAVLSVIEGALKREQEVRLVNFGTFMVTHKKATTGRNPRTGETIQIPATKVPRFKAGKGLKDAVAR